MTFKSIGLAATVAALAFAVPASADEGRVEARGGIAWNAGNSDAIAGVAAGYDYDLGDSAFVGLEGSADKILVSGADVVWGVSGRIGAKLGDQGKLYATGGYTFGEGEDTPHAGAGYQHKLGTNLYAKVEYRHFFSDFADWNAAAVGVGFTF